MTEKKISNPILDEKLDSNGIRNRRRKNIKLGDILRLRKRNLSYREIGLILGCTKQSIGKRLRDWEASKSKENKH
ncbi:MAG: hypothetical protein A2Z57_07435 [Planctomycetes bacterium RIFCSPHIGHO2_12_39_6]|nr:MAG: hypothetical protein A2Z57_07435 [Planctomycetes bacterium RIFCSPHIGHO2_12_39_6]